jgi:hypothetical protein
MILPHARQVEDRYEAMRREVVQGSWGSTPGLTLLLRGGVVAWMLALSASTPSPHTGAVERSAVLPLGSTPEIVCLLAGMVLGRRGEVRA